MQRRRCLSDIRVGVVSSNLGVGDNEVAGCKNYTAPWTIPWVRHPPFDAQILESTAMAHPSPGRPAPTLGAQQVLTIFSGLSPSGDSLSVEIGSDDSRRLAPGCESS